MTDAEEYLHSGSSTSQESAKHRSAAVKAVLAHVVISGLYGRTWREIPTSVGHHGVVSGALSHLHRTGEIVRLTEKRRRCHVYVDPEYALGRDTEPHGGRKTERDLALHMVEAVRALHTPLFTVQERQVCAQCSADRAYVDWPCANARAVGLE